MLEINSNHDPEKVGTLVAFGKVVGWISGGYDSFRFLRLRWRWRPVRNGSCILLLRGASVLCCDLHHGSDVDRTFDTITTATDIATTTFLRAHASHALSPCAGTATKIRRYLLASVKASLPLSSMACRRL